MCIKYLINSDEVKLRDCEDIKAEAFKIYEKSLGSCDNFLVGQIVEVESILKFSWVKLI